LRAAGATACSTRTEIDRNLGPASNGQETAAEPGTVGGLVGAYLAAQCDLLASNDVGLRTGAPVVHETRVAARRLRSTLRVFSDVIHAEPAEELNNELAWYADLLGEVRDREVLSARLTTLIGELPPEQVRGPVEAEITKTLAEERDDATRRLNEEMSSSRYQHLIRLLPGWKTAPPLTHAAPAKGKTAAKYVKSASRTADKRLRKADGDIEQLHRVRRAMKRVRYAAELAKSAASKMKGTERDAKKLQIQLGEHQDAVVAANFIARLSGTAENGNEASGFTYGILMANELHRAAAIRASLGS
jgi:CHAD domain-containing protein